MCGVIDKLFQCAEPNHGGEAWLVPRVPEQGPLLCQHGADCVPELPAHHPAGEPGQGAFCVYDQLIIYCI